MKIMWAKILVAVSAIGIFLSKLYYAFLKSDAKKTVKKTKAKDKKLKEKAKKAKSKAKKAKSKADSAAKKRKTKKTKSDWHKK